MKIKKKMLKIVRGLGESFIKCYKKKKVSIVAKKVLKSKRKSY